MRRVGGAMLACWLALAANLASAAPDAGEAPPCLVEVSTSPERPWTGQQVLYRVRVLRRWNVRWVKFLEPIAFADVRSEWLPGRAEDTKIKYAGESYLVREEHRALFPARAGRIVLPSFPLECQLTKDRVRPLEIPSVTLDVRALPEAGRHDDFQGLIGPLRAQLTANTEEVRIGESVRVSLLVGGATNLWRVRPPFPSDQIDGAQMFRDRPELETEAGKRLYLRRYFRFDLVPHKTGALEIPSLSIPYFDPRSERYKVAHTAPVVIAVHERESVAAGRGRSSTRRGEIPNASTPSRTRVVALVTILLAIVLAGGTLLWRRRAAKAKRWARVDSALAAADIAAVRKDAASEIARLAEAAKIALEIGAGSLDASAEQLLAHLEQIRFSGAGEQPTTAEVRSLIRKLRGRWA